MIVCKRAADEEVYLMHIGVVWYSDGGWHGGSLVVHRVVQHGVVACGKSKEMHFSSRYKLY